MDLETVMSDALTHVLYNENRLRNEFEPLYRNATPELVKWLDSQIRKASLNDYMVRKNTDLFVEQDRDWTYRKAPDYKISV